MFQSYNYCLEYFIGIRNFGFVLTDAKSGRKQPSSSDYLATCLPSDWHHHEDADELFPVTSGELWIELREEPDVILQKGTFAIVPRGIEHLPIADTEAEILLFEPTDTRNVETERTRTDLEQIN